MFKHICSYFCILPIRSHLVSFVSGSSELMMCMAMSMIYSSGTGPLYENYSFNLYDIKTNPPSCKCSCMSIGIFLISE